MIQGDIVFNTCYGDVKLIKCIDQDSNLWWVRAKNGYYSLQINKEEK